MPSAAHVHSLLHVNLNSRDAAAASAFYERVLGLTVGMRTSGEPSSGESLGVAGDATTTAWFLYDARGPRSAPALEILEWRLPAQVGQPPAQPHHLGLAAVGFMVPSPLDVQLTDLGPWPWRGAEPRLLRTLDPDGIALEALAAPELAAPQFSHLRVNVRDLAASVDWYAHIGLTPASGTVRTEVDGAALGLREQAAVSVASLSPAGDPTVSFELTQWHRPEPVGRPITPAYHLGIYRIALGVDDVREAVKTLRRGWDNVPDPIWVALPGTRLGGVTVLFLTDPDGITVELVERPRAAMTARA